MTPPIRCAAHFVRDEKGICSSTGSAAAGYAAAIASRVAVADARRRRVPAEVDGEIGRPDEVDHAERALGERAGLVEADQVDRGERLDRVQLLDERAPARHPRSRDREGEARQQDQPLRDERDNRGDRGRHGRVQRRMPLPQRVSEDQAERHHHHDERGQEPVQRALERRARVAKRPRLAGDLRRVAVHADRLDGEVALALDDERSRPHLAARRPLGGQRLAGEDRLVEPQRGRRLQRPVGHDLVARLEANEVTDYHLRHRDPGGRSVPDDRRRGGDERRQPVERPLGPHLLRDPDRRVRDQHAEKERILPLAEHQRGSAGDGQDQVEEREDVGADDARVRAARPLALRRPFGKPARSFGCGQPGVHGGEAGTPRLSQRQRPMTYGSPGGLTSNTIYGILWRQHEASSHIRRHQEREHPRRACRRTGQTDRRVRRPLHSHRVVRAPDERSRLGLAFHRWTVLDTHVRAGLEVPGSPRAHRAAQHHEERWFPGSERPTSCW